jgi:hypothetical protein
MCIGTNTGLVPKSIIFFVQVLINICGNLSSF